MKSLLGKVPPGIRLVTWDVDGTLYSLPRLKRELTWALLRRAPRDGITRSWKTLRGMQALHDWIDGERRPPDFKVPRSLILFI